MTDRTLTGADLLSLHVVDVDGTDLGRVRDLRLERRGHRWVATGLVAGRRMLSERFGTTAGVIEGPALLLAWLRRRHAHLRRVRWDQVAEITDGTVRLRCRADDLDPVLEARP